MFLVCLGFTSGRQWVLKAGEPCLAGSLLGWRAMECSGNLNKTLE